MTKEELIVKQQLEIENYKEIFKSNKEIIDSLYMDFYAIGRPLNDNILNFNREQLIWCWNVDKKIEAITTIEDSENFD